MDDLGLLDPGVFCTGAQVYSPATGETLLSATMAVEDCWQLLLRLRDLPIYYELYGLNNFYIETDYGAEFSCGLRVTESPWGIRLTR